MFTFSEMLALVQSESSFGAFVFHRRPAGLQATSDLVSLHNGEDVVHIPLPYALSYVLTSTSLEPGPCRASYFPRYMLLLTTTARERAWRLLKIIRQILAFYF